MDIAKSEKNLLLLSEIIVWKKEKVKMCGQNNRLDNKRNLGLNPGSVSHLLTMWPWESQFIFTGEPDAEN